jgi:hypothetical protein
MKLARLSDCRPGVKLVLIIAVLALIEGSATAAPTSETLYNEGQAAYDHADYATAIVKWSASYDLSGANDLLFNLAQARRLSGDCGGALATYKRFIANDPTSEQRPLADDFVRELKPQCRAQASIQALIVDPPVTRPGQRLRLAGLVSGGGIVLIATGLGLGHHAQSIGDEVTRACVTSCDWTVLKDKDAAGRRDAAIGYALDTVGVAAIVGGAILYYLGSNRKDDVHITPLTARTHESGMILSWSRPW